MFRVHDIGTSIILRKVIFENYSVERKKNYWNHNILYLWLTLLLLKSYEYKYKFKNQP